MPVHYLEIVTPDVETICATYAQIHGVTFGAPDPYLGGARTAPLAEGGTIGVRAPMHSAEQPVVRPYTLVEDIVASVAAAEEAGAEIALGPTELPGHGQCAILIQGDVQLGLWQR
ncbi:MAG: hydroxylase [Bacteroidota bacterium]